jgi:succinoglycan biosynthesis transport protein ExoP
VTKLPAPTNSLEQRAPLWPSNSAGQYTEHIRVTQGQIDPRLYWAVVRRHLRLIGAIFLGSLLLSGIIYRHTTPTYTGSTTILVQPRTPEILDIKQPQAGDVPSSYQHDYYETEYDILRSRSLAAQVIHNLGIVSVSWLASPHAQSAPRIPEPLGRLGVPESVIEAYQERLEIKPEIGTRLITVLFTAPDPVAAARIANAHVSAYIKRGMELNADAAQNAQNFLQKRLSELKDRLAKSETALNTYRRDRSIVSSSLDNEAGRLLIRRLADLNTKLDDAEEIKAELEGERQLIQSGDYDSLPEVMHSSVIQGLKEEAARLGEQYASMSNRFNPGYHPLDDLKAQLDDSQARLQKEIRRISEAVDAKYKIQIAREDSLNAEIKGVKAEAMSMNDAAVEDAVLAREVETNRKLHEDVLRRMQEIELSANEPSSNVSVLDRAEPSRQPTSPRIVRDLATGGLLGLLAALGVAFALEFRDDRLRSGAEVEQYLRVPSIGMVRDFAKFEIRSPIAKGVSSNFKSARFPLEDMAGSRSTKEIVVDGSQSSVIAEDYRGIRNAVVFGSSTATPTKILITSAMSGEGKTVTAVNLAIAFSQIGKRVLLIDADLRRPRCHAIFNLQNDEGLTEVLSGLKQTNEVIKSTDRSNLFFLSAGSPVPNPGELLVFSDLRELLSKLNQEYDYLLIDSSPIVPVTDCEGLATLVDGVLLVAGSQSPRPVVQNACLRLVFIGAKILGVILNRVNTADVAYPYRYYDRETPYGRDNPP